MKKFMLFSLKHGLFSTIFLTLIFNSFLTLQSSAQNAQQDYAFSDKDIKKGELIVKLKPEYMLAQFPDQRTGIDDAKRQELQLKELMPQVSFSSVAKTFKLLSKKSQRLNNYYSVKFSEDIDLRQLKSGLEKIKEIENVSFVPLVKTICNPNDPYYNGSSTSWHLDAIDANQIWCSITQGCSNVVIAIVDDAVLTTHEDLTNKIVGQYDVADNDGNANPPYMSNTSFTHGTHVAGIAGAETDNGIGIASLGYNSSLYAVKCTRDNSPNPAFLDAPYEGVEHAIDAGVDVINMSWGGGGFVPAYQDLFSEAYNLGIICVAAAGNNNFPASSYPGAYNHVISVAATNEDNQRACFSNYGTYVDVAAPGEDIFSTLAGSNSSYGYLSGTSMASPLVAAQAALMKCQNPDLNTDEIESCLTNNTLPLDPNPNCNPSTIDEEIPNFVEVFSCDPDSIADCLAPVDCELVWNGDFEQINGTLTSPTDFSQVCFWDRTNSSPYYCASSTDGNSIGLWLRNGDIERITSEDPINFTVGQEYHVSFDYHVTLWSGNPTAPAPQSLQVALTTTNTAGVLPGTATIIAQVNNPPVDDPVQTNHQCHDPGAVFHHFEGCFTYNGAGSEYLNITGQPGATGVSISFIDNVSIRPKIDIKVSALDTCIQCGDCTWLEVSGSGFTDVVWSPEELIETDPTAMSVRVCPKETTTYTVTVYDAESGCTDSRDITIEVKEPEWKLECHLEDGYFCIVDQLGNSPVIEWVSPFTGSTGHCQSTAGLNYGDPLTFIIYTFGEDGKCAYEYTTEYTCEECKCDISRVSTEWPECWDEESCVTVGFWYSGTDNQPLEVIIDNINSTPGFSVASVTNLSNPPGDIIIQGYNEFEICFNYSGECKEKPALYFDAYVCRGAEKECKIELKHQAPCCEEECRCDISDVRTKWPECWDEKSCVVLGFTYSGSDDQPLEVIIDNLNSTPGFSIVSITNLSNPPGDIIVQGYNEFEICFSYSGECREKPVLVFDAYVCRGTEKECRIQQKHEAPCCEEECKCDISDVRTKWPECWGEKSCVVLGFTYSGSDDQPLEVIIDNLNSTPGFSILSVTNLSNPPGDIIVQGYNEFEICFSYSGECREKPALYFDAYVCRGTEKECRIQQKHEAPCCEEECKCEISDVRTKWPECWGEKSCAILSFNYSGTDNQPLEVIIDNINSTPGFSILSVTNLSNPPGDIIVQGYNEFEICFSYSGECREKPILYFDAYVCRGTEKECKIEQKNQAPCCERSSEDRQGSLEQDTKEGDFIIYPNPATDRFTLSFKAERFERTLSITNVNHKTVENRQITPGTNQVSLSTDGFTPGVYFVRLSGDNGALVTKRIIILQ